MIKFKALLGSRKFWAAFIGLVLIVVKAYQPDFPVKEDQLTLVVGTLAAYIIGTAVEDSGSAKSGAAGSVKDNTAGGTNGKKIE